MHMDYMYVYIHPNPNPHKNVFYGKNIKSRCNYSNQRICRTTMLILLAIDMCNKRIMYK